MSDSFRTLWTVAHQAPLSMGFPRQEYWSGLPFLSPGDLPHPEIKPQSSALQTVFFTDQATREAQHLCLKAHYLGCFLEVDLDAAIQGRYSLSRETGLDVKPNPDLAGPDCILGSATCHEMPLGGADMDTKADFPSKSQEESPGGTEGQ